MARLNIPLGSTLADFNCRRNILLTMLDYNEKFLGTRHGELVDASGSYTYVKIPHLIPFKRTKQHKAKPPPTTREKLQRMRTTDAVNIFLESILPSSPCSTRTAADNMLHDMSQKEEAARILCLYLARWYNDAYFEAMEKAQFVQQQNLQQESKKLPTVPDDLTMWDGGNRDDPHDVTWNQRYTDLVDYKQEFGDCLVPSKNSKAVLDEKWQLLRNWVPYQRTAKREQAPSMTPKRIELLEELGFVWVVNPQFFNAKDDPRFHKAMAAKLYFSKALTAKEAYLLSGFPEEEATDDNRKKLLNYTVANFRKRAIKCKPAVLTILRQLRTGDVFGTRESTVREIFGGQGDETTTSHILQQLEEHGKLVPRNEHAEEPSSTGETRTTDDDGNDDDDDEENETETENAPYVDDAAATISPQNNRKRPRLPLGRGSSVDSSDHRWL